jgi:hypothetical protein
VDVACTPQSIAAASTAFVDVVYAAARTTKAAVHSFIGDAAECSWNAAASVAAPAAKAACFLATIAEATSGTAAKDSLLRVGGGAIASRGRIQMAGAGLQQALLLGVADEHERALATLAGAGVAHGCMLVSAAVASESLDVLSCPVATYGGDSPLQAQGALGPAAVAHLIQRTLRASEQDDEWLYVLQAREVQGSGEDHPNSPASPPGLSDPANADGYVCGVVARAFRHLQDANAEAAHDALSALCAGSAEATHAIPSIVRNFMAPAAAELLRNHPDPHMPNKPHSSRALQLPHTA